MLIGECQSYLNVSYYYGFYGFVGTDDFEVYRRIEFVLKIFRICVCIHFTKSIKVKKCVIIGTIKWI